MKTRAATVTAVLVFIVAASLLRSTYFPESDIFWGARNGLDILAKNGLNLTQPDTWNALTLGQEWSPNSWLWNVLLGLAYKGFGYYGFLLLTAGTNLLAYWFLWAYLQKLRMAPLTAFLTLIVCWFSTLAFMNGRANTADLLILTAFLYTGYSLRRRPVFLLATAPLLTALWMNLHLTGAVAVGVFPAVIYAFLREEPLKRRAGASALTAVLCAGAVLLTPYGAGVFGKMQGVNDASTGTMNEWSNVLTNPAGNEGVFIILFAAAALLVFLARRKTFLYALAVVVFAVATVSMVRFAPYLLTVVLAGLTYWEVKSFTVPPRFLSFRKYMKGFVAVVVLGVCSASLFMAGKAVSDPESMFRVRPSDFTAVPSGAVVGVLQDAGSEMILFHPNALVTFDGRNDLLGKDRFIEAGTILLSPDSGKLSKWLGDHHVSAVFVGQQELGSGAVAANMRQLGWVEKPSGDSLIFLNPSMG